jgi:glycosyltransferase involved in cell wall biosynthesis
VGDAAVVFNPTDADALAYALGRLATDDAWARERATAGLARARAFTWDASARALGRVYDEAVARRAGRPGPGAAAPPAARAVS